jgi:hypothetical protein
MIGLKTREMNTTLGEGDGGLSRTGTYLQRTTNGFSEVQNVINELAGIIRTRGFVLRHCLAEYAAPFSGHVLTFKI